MDLHTVVKKISSNKKYVLIGVAIVIVLLGLFIFLFNKVVVFSNSDEYEVLKTMDNNIDDYLKKFGDSFSRTNKYYSFKVCSNGENTCNKKNMKKVSVQLIGIHSEEKGTVRQEITIENLILAGYYEEDFVNPSNNKTCFYISGDNVVNPTIVVYLDEDNKKYYYYVDLSGNNTACNFRARNSFITNFPDNLVKSLKKAKVDLPKQFK